MTTKQLQTVKIINIIFMAALAGYCVVTNHYIWLLAGFLVSALLLVMLRRRVTEVLADERDRHVAGQAALAAMYVFCFLAAIIALAAFAMRDLNQTNEVIALTLAYSACLILVVYTLAFRLYNRWEVMKRKGLMVSLGFIILAIIALAGLRVLSPEDDWVCQDGQRAKHGQPELPMPSMPCEK